METLPTDNASRKRKFKNAKSALSLCSSAPLIASSNWLCTQSCTEGQVLSEVSSIYIPATAHANSSFWATIPEDLATRDEVDEASTNKKENSSIYAAGLSYHHSFHGKDIAISLFGANKLHFQGSQVTNRQSTALIADYFGLSPNFDGTIHFAPKVAQTALHLQQHFALEQWCPGLYIEVDSTITHVQQTLTPSCCALDSKLTGTGNHIPFPAGYMAPGTFSVAPGTTTVTVPAGAGIVQPAASIAQVLRGDFLFGDMQTPWKFGKFSERPLSMTGIDGLDLILGYEIFTRPTATVGLFGVYSIPTGNRPSPTFVFSPVIGNMHHHEIGAGLNAQWQVWQGRKPGTFLTMYLDGQVTTLLPDYQVRSFDFVDKGALSRYMLLKELTPIAAQRAVAGDTGQATLPEQLAYTGSLINGINFATRYVRAAIPVSGQAMLRLIYRNNNSMISFGYELTGIANEQLALIPDASPCSAVNLAKNYGFKGTTGCYSYSYGTTSPLVADARRFVNYLNATASSATISESGTIDRPANPLPAPTFSNLSADWRTGLNEQQANQLAGASAELLVPALESSPAQAISVSDLDISSGVATSSISHKGILAYHYFFSETHHAPFIVVGIEVEGGMEVSDYKQWGAWIKGGISF